SEHGTLLRHALQDTERALGRLGVEIGLKDVVGVTVHQPDVADGKLLDIRRGIERGPVRLGFLDQVCGLIPVSLVDVIGRIAKVLERGREKLARAVEHGYTALYL